MISATSTTLTERQVEVLELREAGHTQQEVAEMLGTTDSNVSAIERAAEENVEKAHGTLELLRVVRSPVRFAVEAGTSFDELVDQVYERGDETGIKLAYCRPELYTHLFGRLEEHTVKNRLETAVEFGLTRDGDVTVFAPEA
ncbi:Tfx family DNA-binding protein [Haloplanus pelagicus]|uniref:Tfx family DNA-binding protein n=1 Tax=Haloplanus pelagicus TaxID=2949995 RepID=UPI00203D01CA|nr:Tfx family DNA-binding protein [Haloplanus sp. HW8-1]